MAVVEGQVEETKADPAVEVKAEPEPKVEAKTEPEGEVKAEGEPKPKPDWRDARIDELTYKVNEAARKLAAVQAGPAIASAKATGETEADFQARVDAAASARAVQIAEVADWNRQCNEVAEAGQKEFKDFGERLNACKSVVNGNDALEFQQFNDLLHAAIETGHAHRLIHALGETPGEVKRLMNVSPAKRIVELTRLADKIAPPEPRTADPDPSGAPKPITPLGSKGLHYDGIKPDDAVNGTKLPIGQWMKLRDKQVEERGLQ